MTIEQARKKKGKSMNQMSREAKIPLNMLFRYEHLLTIPSVTRAKELADYLEISLEDVEKFFREV
jgi:ribosome-binding protein aMBF1 (putative translation factor)